MKENWKELGAEPAVFPFFERAIDEQMHDLGSIRTGPYTSIVFAENAILLRKETRSGSIEWPVIRKPFAIVQRVEVEQELRIVAEDEGGRFVGTFTDIFRRLDNHGQVLSRNDAHDVVSHLVGISPNHARGFATFGVYEQNGQLALPSQFYPRNGAQREAVNALEPHLAYAPTKEDWKAYERFIRFYEPREILPALALAVIAPFTPILRPRNVIVPGIFHFSRSHGTGKSKAAWAACCRVWPLDPMSADDLGSDFRLDAYFDQVACPRVIEESQSFQFGKHSGQLKQAFEGPRAGSRGRNDQELNRYRSYASFIFTTQTAFNLPPALNARFLIVRFNELRQDLPEAVRRDFADTFEKLRAVGPTLIRCALAGVDGNPIKLIQIVEHELQPMVERLKICFADHRRQRMWAYLYWGLTAWAKASFGIVQIPDLDSFARDVIEPIETATRRAGMNPLSEFAAWFERWKTRNEMGDGRVRGDDRMFRSAMAPKTNLPGHLITRPLLDEYNRDQKEFPEAKIHDLPELADLVERQYHVPHDELFANGRVRNYKFAARGVPAVFLPDVGPDESNQASLGDGPPPDTPPPQGRNGGEPAVSNGPKKPVFADVAAIIKRLSTQHGAVTVETVADEAANSGMDAMAVTDAVDYLLRVGRVTRAADGAISYNDD